MEGIDVLNAFSYFFSVIDLKPSHHLCHSFGFLLFFPIKRNNGLSFSHRGVVASPRPVLL